MARPRKDTDLVRPHRVTFRLADVEYELIKKKSGEAEVSMSEYMRKSLLGGKLTVTHKMRMRFHLLSSVNPCQNTPQSFFVKSDLRLVVDLQNNVKAQRSRAYLQKVKLTNLKQMALTVAYVQEHGYDSRDDLRASYDEIADKRTEARKPLRATEDKLKAVNEQIHYTGQYFSN